jgi:hypothetical protein
VPVVTCFGARRKPFIAEWSASSNNELLTTDNGQLHGIAPDKFDAER